MLAQLALVVAGLWLEFAPSVLDYGEPAATSDRVAGPLMAAAAFLAIFAITRGLRWFNLPVGAWLVTAPWLLDFPTDATVSSVVCGVAALVLAPVGSLDQSRYGGAWRALWEIDRLPDAQSE
ncbi:MAG: SPW repeat protein [Actinomycetota bacterium]|nr:SPW repeat protein [Actinomycetota bacterium]